jgi:xanthine dehydrogenase accessory factor
VVLGGGHISLALEHILKFLDFHVIIVDDRTEFANRERFVNADKIFCMDFEDYFKNPPPGMHTYYVIVTRGHIHDYVCLKHVLNTTYDYVGMIGSKIKVAQTLEKLRLEGYSDAAINQIHAPIGLPLGGSTPEEIAISIAAEILVNKNKRERNCFPYEWTDVLIQDKEPLYMATVIDKAGSAPRGKGSRMLVTKSGTILGSIGGGAVEDTVIRQVTQSTDIPNFTFTQYDLSNKDASGLGMICGGCIKVML